MVHVQATVAATEEKLMLNDIVVFFVKSFTDIFITKKHMISSIVVCIIV